MSTTTIKRPYAQAREEAAEFYRLFPSACFSRWCGAGSLRRKRPEVGDVERGWRGAWADVRWLHAEEVARGMAPAITTSPTLTNGNDQGGFCPGCGSGDALELPMVPAPDEETYFRLCGLAWVKPEERAA